MASFSLPIGIAVTLDGEYLYVSNSGADNIKKYQLPADPAGAWKLVKVLGSTGEGGGEFNGPSGIALDKEGNVFAADALNGRIEEFSADGKYITQINYSQSGFWRPRGVLASKDGAIYVANTGKWNIYKFNYKGVMTAPFRELYGEVFGLAMDASGRLYAADAGSRSVFELSPGLEVIKRHKITAWMNSDGTMPMIALDSKQRLYAVAQNEKKIVVYDTTSQEFTYIGEIKKDTTNALIFDNPVGIAIDAKDNVYVTERFLNKVIMIKPEFNTAK